MKKRYILIVLFLFSMLIFYLRFKEPQINAIVLGRSVDKIKIDWSVKELIQQYPNVDYIYVNPVYEGSKYGISSETLELIINKTPTLSGEKIVLDRGILYNALFIYSELGISVVFMHGKVNSIHAWKAATYYDAFFKAKYTIKNSYSGSYKGKIRIGTSKEVVEEIIGPMFYTDGWYNYKYGEIDFNYDDAGFVIEIIVKGGSSD